MSAGQGQDDGGGCAALIGVVLVVGATFAALVSIAALIDPFAWMPSVTELWEDCQEEYDPNSTGDECDWENRFPGIWVHGIVNLLYASAASGLLVWVASAVKNLRDARVERFSDADALERYVLARQALTAASVWTALVAAVPIAAAMA